MQIEMLLPQNRQLTLDELRNAVVDGDVAEPFHKSVLAACADFSERVFHDPEARRHPEMVALAYSMRKSELSGLAEQFRALELENRVLVPRGLVFHVPPRNVDTMFVYSWLHAALTGNRSVIRLSSQRSDAANILVRLLRETLATSEETTRGSTVIVSYGHEEEATALLSSLCDVRVIWGGDQTVQAIRRSPLTPHAKEITFPDRYSMAAVKAEAYAALSQSDRDCLVRQFFNDSYLFDQMACSSPRLVVWCGTVEETHSVSADFFSRLAACVARRQHVLQAASSIQNLVFTCSTIIGCQVESCRRHKGLTVLTVGSLTDFQRDHPGGGLFFEVHLANLIELSRFLRRRDQTLTWFGFAPSELQSLLRILNGRAIDRLVPMGRALQFHRFWDGYDLLQEFCRCVYVDSTPVLLSPNSRPTPTKRSPELQEGYANPATYFG